MICFMAVVYPAGWNGLASKKGRQENEKKQETKRGNPPGRRAAFSRDTRA